MKILACASLILAATCANAAAPTQITATVKKIGQFSESGDGYTFKTKDGKQYYVYNAGGGSPIPGEKFITESEKKGTPICLKLTPPDGMGDIASVTPGACKP
ncbi:hypothetical protein [Vitreoscilla filiformis]|jgi:hypothetical protein|uniref:hypothetical protein n=1 Tax=Vitreoscilla filiformis TaxID=63 RepID=UPI000B79C233|nr:hypothetical protein [Vitreoscilla filiformis]